MVKKLDFGRCLLQEILDRKKLSRSYITDRTGMTKQQISSYINNDRTMSFKNAKLIADVVGCHVDDLYEWIYE